MNQSFVTLVVLFFFLLYFGSSLCLKLFSSLLICLVCLIGKHSFLSGLDGIQIRHSDNFPSV